MNKIFKISIIISLAVFSVACSNNKKTTNEGEIGLYDHLTPQSLFFKEVKTTKEPENIGKIRIMEGLIEPVYLKIDGVERAMIGEIDAETKATSFQPYGEMLRKLEMSRDSHPHNIKMSKDVVELYFVSAVKVAEEIPELTMKTFILNNKVVSYNEWEYLRVYLDNKNRSYYGTYLVKVYDDKFEADQSNTGREGTSKVQGTTKWDPSDMSITYTINTEVDGTPITLEAKYKYKRLYVDYEAYAPTFYKKGYKNYHFGNK